MSHRDTTVLRALAHTLLALLALPLAVALAGCAAPGAAPGTGRAGAQMQAEPGRYIVLAVDNPLGQPGGRAGASLGGYGLAARYLQGQQAAGELAALAHDHGLREVAGWPIVALGWQCVVFELDGPAAGRRDALVATLATDPRVRLVQPLQEFETLVDAPSAPPGTSPAAPPALAYNDPYVHLQRGFADLAAAQAHRVSVGAGVRVAVVDTGAATSHPDLQGRVALARDFVNTAADAGSTFDADRHGTQVAGIIAAAGNNHHGIVGIAPLARLDLHKACWQREGAPAGAARCNSFTLAQALAAVLASDARVVNLSLGGPADPLLDRLLAELLKQGRTVVGALPPDGRRGGFPTGTPGVIAVANAGSAGASATPATDVVLAPGQDVLTLQPGGTYDYASGSSIAAAHVSGVAALLLAAEPRLPPQRLRTLLGPGSAAPLNASAALDALLAPGATAARR